MLVLLWLVPLSILAAGIGLAILIWSIRNNQYDDLDGAANRILFDDEKKQKK